MENIINEYIERIKRLFKKYQPIADIIKSDKDFLNHEYYADVYVTPYDDEQDREGYNGYDKKELIYDSKDIDDIRIYKIINEGYLCDDMPDDTDYGFHDPYEPTKEIIYVVHGRCFGIHYKYFDILEAIVFEREVR